MYCMSRFKYASSRITPTPCMAGRARSIILFQPVRGAGEQPSTTSRQNQNHSQQRHSLRATSTRRNVPKRKPRSGRGGPDRACPSPPSPIVPYRQPAGSIRNSNYQLPSMLKSIWRTSAMPNISRYIFHLLTIYSRDTRQCLLDHFSLSRDTNSLHQITILVRFFIIGKKSLNLVLNW
jgi:hypothetical protein